MQTSNRQSKVPVTMAALIQRVRRAVARDGGAFHIGRGEADHAYYSIDSNVIDGTWSSQQQLITYARREGILKAHEEVVS